MGFACHIFLETPASPGGERGDAASEATGRREAVRCTRATVRIAAASRTVSLPTLAQARRCPPSASSSSRHASSCGLIWPLNRVRSRPHGAVAGRRADLPGGKNRGAAAGRTGHWVFGSILFHARFEERIAFSNNQPCKKWPCKKSPECGLLCEGPPIF